MIANETDMAALPNMTTVVVDVVHAEVAWDWIFKSFNKLLWFQWGYHLLRTVGKVSGDDAGQTAEKQTEADGRTPAQQIDDAEGNQIARYLNYSRK